MSSVAWPSATGNARRPRLGATWLKGTRRWHGRAGRFGRERYDELVALEAIDGLGASGSSRSARAISSTRKPASPRPASTSRNVDEATIVDHIGATAATFEGGARGLSRRRGPPAGGTSSTAASSPSPPTSGWASSRRRYLPQRRSFAAALLAAPRPRLGEGASTSSRPR